MTLVHELAHVLAAEHTAWHPAVLARLWIRHSTRHIRAVIDHLMANVLHEAVAAMALPDEPDLPAIARGWRGLSGAWDIIDRDGAGIRRIVLAARAADQAACGRR
jgi:hypothetical protein